MYTIENCKERIFSLTRELKSKKDNIRKLRNSNTKLNEKRNDASGGLIYGAITVLASGIAFMINPTLLPYIIVGCGLVGLGAGIIGFSAHKRNKCDKLIDANNKKIDSELNEIEEIQYTLAKYEERLKILYTREREQNPKQFTLETSKQYNIDYAVPKSTNLDDENIR